MRCRQEGREERREKEREKKRKKKKIKELCHWHTKAPHFWKLQQKALPRGGAPLLYKSLRNFEPWRAVVWDDTQRISRGRCQGQRPSGGRQSQRQGLAAPCGVAALLRNPLQTEAGLAPRGARGHGRELQCPWGKAVPRRSELETLRERSAGS